MSEPNRAKDGLLWPAAAAAIIGFIPFIRLFLERDSLYFRDLSAYFIPGRKFILEGLGRGELRFWNPLTHEGTPLLLSSFGYFPDLLQLLIPNEFGISLFLALHIPMAAVSFTLLARELRIGPLGAVAGAGVYALGGFSLSSLNLYVYTQAIAWAPLFVMAFRRLLERGGSRELALAAITLSILVSTTGLEIVIQTCILAVLLTPPDSRLRLLRAAAAAGLALALSAAVVAPLLSASAGSERTSGFSPSVMLAHSIHPLTLFQVFIAGFYGETSNITGLWWGENFFPMGFPYILSLYLGPTVVALAIVGITVKRPLRRRLGLLALIAILVGLGRYAGWESVVELSPGLRFLRYPVKAFFTAQFCVALLTSLAADALVNAAPGYLTRLCRVSMGLGGAFAALPLLPWIAPQWTGWFLYGFLPPQTLATQRAQIGAFIANDAATGGAVAIIAGALCWMAGRNLLTSRRAAIAVVALVAADLVRAGAGLNPGVTTDFYQVSPEMHQEMDLVRQSGGRVYTCDIEKSPSYWNARFNRGVHHETLTMAALQETMTPDFHLPFGVRTALSPDRTSLVATRRVLTEDLSDCTKFPLMLPLLRSAGVTRVVSLELLDDPALRLLTEIAPHRIAPLKIRVYELAGGLPRFSEPVTILHENSDTLEIEVVVDLPTGLIVREPMSKGWRATVNGIELSILSTPDGHREVPLGKGRSHVRMWYDPPGLVAGISISLVAGLVCLICLFLRI